MTRNQTPVLFILASLISACGGLSEEEIDAKISAISSETTTTETSSSTEVISAIRRIGAYSSNICTRFANELGYFTGGQIVTFADASVLMSGNWVFSYFSQSGDFDSDMDNNSPTVFIPAWTNTAHVVLSNSVARGTAGYNNLFLVYYRATDTAKLVYDSNSNLVPDASDSVISTLTITAW